MKNKKEKRPKSTRGIKRGALAPKVKGDDPVRERVRVLYAEPPQKTKGRPFIAFRLNGDAKKAFAKHAKTEKVTPAELLRQFITKVTGVEASAVDDGGEE